MRVPAVVLLLVLSACATVPGPPRSVHENVLTSTELPRIRIAVEPPFRYAGRVPFQIAGLAAGDRYVFVDTEGRRVKRLFVAQFESWLPGIDEIYHYDFTGARELGGHRWRHNIGWYSQRASREAQPRGEAAAMHRWLEREGYEVDDELLMSRFLTLGDEQRKSELILFYIENAGENGVTLAELDADESRMSAFARELEERSLAAFRILP